MEDIDTCFERVVIMPIMEAIDARHSVRAYKDAQISTEIREQLDGFDESRIHYIE